MTNPQMLQSSPSPENAFDFATARALMVKQQVQPWDVLDPRVLDVLGQLPREAFVAETQRTLAYVDLPLPLPHGEVMMKPVLEGRVLQALAIKPGDDVLEIGTGSGYLTACLARLARDVVSIERHADLADLARARLTEQRIRNADVVHADAFADATYSGSLGARRFSAICVTGAVSQVPAQFLQWLKPDGRMFIVHGRSPVMDAALVHNDNGSARIESLFETDIPYLVGAAPAPAFEL